MILRLNLPRMSRGTSEGRITPAKSLLHSFGVHAILNLPRIIEFGTNLAKFDHFVPAQFRGRSRAWRLHPTSGLSVQDAFDSKSQQASVLILWTSSEDNAPKGLASRESVRLGTRLSCGARFTDSGQRTVVGQEYPITH